METALQAKQIATLRAQELERELTEARDAHNKVEKDLQEQIKELQLRLTEVPTRNVEVCAHQDDCDVLNDDYTQACISTTGSNVTSVQLKRKYATFCTQDCDPHCPKRTSICTDQDGCKRYTTSDPQMSADVSQGITDKTDTATAATTTTMEHCITKMGSCELGADADSRVLTTTGRPQRR